MLKEAKRKFMTLLLTGPQSRPKGFAGGQPGWDHNVRFLLNLGHVEATPVEGREHFSSVAFTPAGRAWAEAELAPKPAKPKSYRGPRTGQLGDLPYEERIAFWVKMGWLPK